MDQALRELYGQGRLTLPRPNFDAWEEQTRGVPAAIVDYERIYRLNLPGHPPPLDLSAACWGAAMFLRAAQCLVYRDVDQSLMERMLAATPPDANAPATHYSVDLTFRFLPDLFRLARAAAQQDPLLETLARWAASWPLSSVGIPAVQHAPTSVEVIANHPCLLRVYVDRMIASNDASQVDHPQIRDALQAAVGGYAALADRIAIAGPSA